MRRWWRGIYADHRDRTRRGESPRRFCGSAAQTDAARLRSARPAPGAASGQHRHAAGGRRPYNSRDMADSRLTLRVFISSPGDVAEERRIAREVIDGLGSGHLLRDKVHFEVVAWDDPDASTPMDGRETPQASVTRFSGRPADCDLTLVMSPGYAAAGQHHSP